MDGARFFIRCHFGLAAKSASAMTASTALACVAQFRAQRCNRITVTDLQGKRVTEDELRGLARFSHEPLTDGEDAGTRL